MSPRQDVGTRCCLQIMSGTVNRTEPRGPNLSVLHLVFNLHPCTDLVASVWGGVVKSTRLRSRITLLESPMLRAAS